MFKLCAFLLLVGFSYSSVAMQCRDLFSQQKLRNRLRLPGEPHISYEKIVEVIKYLSSQGVRPSVVAMARGDSYHPALSAKNIMRNTGVKATSQRVFIDATKRHGKDWEWWLREAELDAARVSSRRFKFLREQDIIAVIEYLIENSPRLDEKFLLGNHDNNYVLSSSAIAFATGLQTTTARVVVDATNSGRSWDSWIERVIQKKRTEKLKSSLSEHDIVRVIQYLQSKQYDLSENRVLETPVSALEIQKNTGVYTTLLKLFKDATAQQNWNWWLEQAGINSYYVNKHHRLLSHTDILKVIRFVKSQGIEPSLVNMKNLNSNFGIDADIIFNSTGIKIDADKTVLDAVEGYGRDWSWWRQHAGL